MRIVLADAVATAELYAPVVDPVPRIRIAQAQSARRRGYAFSLTFIALVAAVQLLPRPALAEPRCAGPLNCAAQVAAPAVSAAVLSGRDHQA